MLVQVMRALEVNWCSVSVLADRVHFQRHLGAPTQPLTVQTGLVNAI